MTELDSDTSISTANRTGAAQAAAWLACGWSRFRREPEFWIGMTLLYFGIALLLKRIPFMGDFVLVLITPLLLAGALRAARASVARGTRAAPGRRLEALLLRPLRALFQAFGEQEKLLAHALVCVLTLGFVILVSIPEFLITGGSVLSGLVGGGLAGPLRPALLIGIGVVAVLYLLLAMALYYLVPLVEFGGRPPLAAAVESFRACARNAVPLTLFSLPFIVANALIASAFSIAHWLGYALTFSLGLVALPVFVLGLYCSYRDLYETQPNAEFGMRNKIFSPQRAQSTQREAK